jgi:hypothetical protein
MAFPFRRALKLLPRVRLNLRKRQRGICVRRTRLLGELTSALEEVLLLYRRQQRAMANGDVLFRRLDRPIEKYTIKVQSARNAYWGHIRRHGC